MFVANVFIVLPFLQVSATVRRLLPGWVGLKKKHRKYATPKMTTLNISENFRVDFVLVSSCSTFDFI